MILVNLHVFDILYYQNFFVRNAHFKHVKGQKCEGLIADLIHESHAPQHMFELVVQKLQSANVFYLIRPHGDRIFCWL